MQFWNSTYESIATIAGLIVAVALLSVIVSKKSNTAGVIQAAGTAFSSALGVAEAPVTGASYTPNLTYPNQGGIGGMTNMDVNGFSFAA